MAGQTKGRSTGVDQFSVQCFISIAENLNLSRAAEEMCITQPAISAQLKKLEKEMGARLVNRTSHEMSLTQAGNVVYDCFRRMNALYNETIRKAQAIDQKRTILRVGYEGPNNWANVQELFSEYLADYPEYEIEIFEGEWGDLLYQLQDGVLDLVFVEQYGASSIPDLQWMPLFKDGVCFLMRSDHPLAGRTSLTIREVLNETIFTKMDASVSMQQIFREFLQAGIPAENIRCVRGQQTSVTMSMAANALAALPRSFKRTAPGGEFICADLSDSAIQLHFCAAWRADDDSVQVKQFLNYCSRFSWPEETAGD